MLKQLVEYDVRPALLQGLVQLLRPSLEQLQLLRRSEIIDGMTYYMFTVLLYSYQLLLLRQIGGTEYY